MRWVRQGALGVALGVAAVTSTAQAQEVGRVQFLAGGGSSIALSDLGDLYNNGPHLIGGVQFLPARFPVGIRVDGMWQRISGDEDVIGDDNDIQFFNGTANAVYAFPVAPTTRIQPYILGGVGIYNAKAVGDAVPDDVESETDFGVNAGAGFDFRATDNLGIFLEGRFHLVFTEEDEVPGSFNSNILPISLGVRVGR